MTFLALFFTPRRAGTRAPASSLASSTSNVPASSLTLPALFSSLVSGSLSSISISAFAQLSSAVPTRFSLARSPGGRLVCGRARLQTLLTPISAINNWLAGVQRRAADGAPAGGGRRTDTFSGRWAVGGGRRADGGAQTPLAVGGGRRAVGGGRWAVDGAPTPLAGGGRWVSDGGHRTTGGGWWAVGGGGRRAVGGGRRVAGGGRWAAHRHLWRTADGGRRAAGGGRRVVGGGWTADETATQSPGKGQSAKM